MIDASEKIEGHKSIRTTLREQEILDLLCDGYTNKEIADRLSISPHTVVSHKKNMRARLGAKNVVHLVALLCKTKNSCH